MKRSTVQLTVNAMLAALCAVLGYLAVDMVSIKITFESFPVLLAGLLYGPVNGALVGFAGTFIYQLLRYGMEASTPLWIVPYVIAGCLIGILAKKASYDHTKTEIRILMPAMELLIFLMNTVSLFLYSKLLYGNYSWAFVLPALPTRFLIAVLKGIAYALVTWPILIKMSVITHNGKRHRKQK